MNKYLYFPLLALLLAITGISETFGQEAGKSKKEKIEAVGRELGLDKDKSAKLMERQEKYRVQVMTVLKDTSLRPQQRSARLKSLAQEQSAALNVLLSPQQREKMSAAIGAQNGSRATAHQKEIESRLPGKNGKRSAVDSVKAKMKN
jgi:CRISPR/Cas system-associated endonuclease Cas3-HD